MSDKSIRSIAAAVLMQAVRDYVKATENKKKAILKDLRSSWLDFLSDGFSLTVATQLEKNPVEIAARLQRAATTMM